MTTVCTRCLTPLPDHPVVVCPVCGTPVGPQAPSPSPQQAEGSSNGKLLAGCGVAGCLGLIVAGVLGAAFLGFLGLRSPSPGPVVPPAVDPGGSFGVKRAAELPGGAGAGTLNLPVVGQYAKQATYPLTAVGDLFRPGMSGGAISVYGGGGATVSFTVIMYPSAGTPSERVDAFYTLMVNEYGSGQVRRGSVVGPDGRVIGVRMIIEEPVTGPVPALHPCFGHAFCQHVYWSNGNAVMFSSGPTPHAAAFHDAHPY